MNREIKFDVILWDPGVAESIEHYDIQEAIAEDFIDFSNGVMKPMDESVIIREYTGLKDCNGREIYEGDIVKTNEADWVAQVTYHRDCFMCTGLDHKGFSSECNWEDFEVIGNIYENPEFLKGGRQ